MSVRVLSIMPKITEIFFRSQHYNTGTIENIVQRGQDSLHFLLSENLSHSVPSYWKTHTKKWKIIYTKGSGTFDKIVLLAS